MYVPLFNHRASSQPSPTSSERSRRSGRSERSGRSTHSSKSYEEQARELPESMLREEYKRRKALRRAQGLSVSSSDISLSGSLRTPEEQFARVERPRPVDDEGESGCMPGCCGGVGSSRRHEAASRGARPPKYPVRRPSPGDAGRTSLDTTPPSSSPVSPVPNVIGLASPDPQPASSHAKRCASVRERHGEASSSRLRRSISAHEIGSGSRHHTAPLQSDPQ